MRDSHLHDSHLRDGLPVLGLLVAVPAVTVAEATIGGGMFAAIVVVGLVAIWVSPAWTTCLYALAIGLAEPGLDELFGVPSAATKAVLIALAGIAVLRQGLARQGRCAVLFFGVWLLALAWSFLSPDPYGLGAQGMVVAWLGFLAGWSFLLPRLEPETVARVLTWLIRAPLAVVLVGVLFWPLRSPLAPDASGLLRLQGMSIPPHLAMAAFVALAASIYATSKGLVRRGHGWVLLNAAIATATLTRGAIAAVAVLLIVGVVLRPSSPQKRAAKCATVAMLAIVGGIALFGALQRNQGNEYEGTFNASGRRQAWDFFLAVADRHPWSGSGLGASAVANAAEAPPGVQAAFIAPHNEFIHLYVDMGWMVAAVVLGATALLIGSLASRAAGVMEALGLLAGLGVLALIDNPLSTPSIPLMLAVLLGIYRSSVDGEDHDRSSRQHQRRRRAGETSHHRPLAGAQRLALDRGGGEQLPG